MKLVIEFDETYWSKEEVSKMSDDVIRALPFNYSKNHGDIVRIGKDRRTLRWIFDMAVIAICMVNIATFIFGAG